MEQPLTVPAALEQVVDALRRFANTVEASPDHPRDVMEAREAVLIAGERFIAAVGGSTGWYTRLFESVGAEGAHERHEPLPDGTRLSVQIRHDFVIQDRSRLLAAGRAAYAASWPDHPPAAAEQWITNESHAVHELIHARGIDALLTEDDWHGLAGAGAETVVLPVDIALGDDPD